MLAGLYFAALLLSLVAQSPDASAIVQRCDAVLRGQSQEGEAMMTVRSPDWERTLKMKFWWVNPDRSLIRITSPAKEAGTGTLRLGTNMWMYLPSVERTIKIPPSMMLQPWMGSDFSNDDLVRESSLVQDYTHQAEGDAQEGGDPCFRVVSTPKADAPVVWGRLVLLIRKSDYLPRREEFYDEKGRLMKVLTYEDIRPAGSRNYPMRWTMKSVTKPGHETVLEFRSLVFDRQLPSRIFTQENLKRVL